MSDIDDIEQIRERKREELKEKLSESAEETTVPDAPIQITGTDDLRNLINEYSVVLLDFYADWCGPCKMMEPTIESIASDTEVVVGKIDIDTNQSLATQYNVRGVPTLLLWHEGEVVEQMTGVQDQETLETLISRYT
ncbi:MAG: thioredoxin [Halobacteriaceae archaeon]